MRTADNYSYRWYHYLLWPLWVVIYYIGLVVFGLLALTVNVCTFFTAFLPQGSWRVGFYQAMMRWMSIGCLKLYALTGIMRVEYLGFESIETRPKVTKPLLIANHPSLLDVFTFYPKIPRLTCIYKSSLGKTLIKGGMGAQIGFISNANTRQMIREGAAKISQGEQMLIFPEGTRTVKKPINVFRLGAIAIAKKAEVELQAVHIFSNSNVLSKEQSIFRIPKLPIRYVLELGESFDPADYERHQDLNEQLEQYFAAHLEAGPRV